MKRWICAIALLGAAWSCAQAEVPTPQTVPAEERPESQEAAKVDEILDRLDKAGDALRDFMATLVDSETDDATGATTTRYGKVYYQRRADGDERVRVAFDRKETPTGSDEVEQLDYLLDGGWLTDRDHRRRISIRRQVQRPGDKTNVLSLGEGGAFPLPLGQAREDVHAQFEVGFVAPAATDPPNTNHLRLVPRPGTRFARKLHSLDIWVDGPTGMPVRIDTVDPNEVSTRTTELKEIQVNANLDEALFTLPPVNPDDWQIREEPFEE